MYIEFLANVQAKYLKPREEEMMTPINILPEYSEQFDVVLLQLMKAKHEMGSAVKKDSANPFHKSKYASLGAHLDLCEDVLFSHGLLMMHTTNFVDGVHMLIATLHHPESKQWTKSYLPLPNPKNDSQGVGASVTYMRRYSINAMLGLNAEDDDGETASGRGQYAKKEAAEKTKSAPLAPPVAQATVGQSQPNFNKQKVNPVQVEAIKSLEVKLDKVSKDKLYARLAEVYNINRIEDLDADNFTKVLGGFQNSAKYVEDQQKQSKIQRLEVAHA